MKWQVITTNKFSVKTSSKQLLENTLTLGINMKKNYPRNCTMPIIIISRLFRIIYKFDSLERCE
jgi:hypothetical protein